MKRVVLLVGILCVLSACEATAPTIEPKPLEIVQIHSTSEPIENDKPIPEFKTHFEEGTQAMYTYVWIANAETQTGSYKVRLRWFQPNDFRPPISQQIVEMQPGQAIAQFSIHNEDGLPKGPYQLLARTGQSFSASGSSRVFIGMTEEEAATFVEEEMEFRRKRDEERAKREAERKAQEELEALSGTGETVDTKKKGGEEELPPALTDGAGKEGEENEEEESS